ncbi:hypothetical protein [Nocardia gipuzkoensis]|uniref:hypothetical protein n=1 Tax=Nocardia gipuzkoensis TaxID=2749991 RepID=UPI003EE2D7AB
MNVASQFAVVSPLPVALRATPRRTRVTRRTDAAWVTGQQWIRPVDLAPATAARPADPL